jgi:3-oxoadipate enol-lactonase
MKGASSPFQIIIGEGEKMEYKIIGKGEPVVLIHGLGQTYHAWHLQEELSDQFQLIMPNLRGHGLSGMKQNISLYQFAQDILQMLDDNGIKKAHFCGLSLGGVIVQEIYRQAPTRVKSMILANSTSYVPCWSSEFVFADRMRSFNRLSDEEYIEDTVRNCLYKPDKYMVSNAIPTFHINRETYIDCSRSIIGINYLPLLSRCVPIHIIASSHDNVTPYLYNAYVMKLNSPASKMSVFNKTGHLSNIQKPEQFNTVLRSFIENIQK